MAGVAFGQTRTGRINKDPYCFAAVCSSVGTTLVDGSKLICKAGGTAWFVSPASTEITSAWANGQYNNVCATDPAGLNKNISCISEWGTLGACLSAVVSCYNASEWFVPSCSQLSNPGYCCRTNWTTSSAVFWSSTEISNNNAETINFGNGGIAFYNGGKGGVRSVRAFKSVNY